MSNRSPFRPSRGLVAAGLACSLVFVPGLARAEGEPPAVPGVSDVIDDLGSGGTEVAEGTGDAEGADGGESGVPAFTIPPELQEALDQAGISEECVSQFQATIEEFLAELEELFASGAAEFEELQTAVEEFLDQLATDPAAALDPESLDPADFPGAEELQALLLGFGENLQELAEQCQPAPATSAPGTTPPASDTPEYTPPAGTTQPSTPAQPVQYLGYAPTGADGVEETSANGPMALLGGAVLVSAATAAVGFRRRARATGSQ